jgi:hypothetical protein
MSTPVDEGNLFLRHSRRPSETYSKVSRPLPTRPGGRVVGDIPDFCRELVAALAEG